MIKQIILLIFLLALVPVVSADVILPGTHAVDKCVKILDDAPQGYSLVAHTMDPTGISIDSKIIQKDECLSKGYKFNKFVVLLVNNSYFEVRSLEKLDPYLEDMLTGELIIISSEEIDPWGGYVEDSSPLVKQIINYRVQAPVIDGNLALDENFLVKVEEIEEYEDGTKKSVWKNRYYYSEPEPLDPNPDVIVKEYTFWESIGCFFKMLFGGTCPV